MTFDEKPSKTYRSKDKPLRRFPVIAVYMYTVYEPTKITYTAIHHETMYCITCRKRPVSRDPTPSVPMKRRKILVDVDRYKFEKLLKFTHDMYYRRLSFIWKFWPETKAWIHMQLCTKHYCIYFRIEVHFFQDLHATRVLSFPNTNKKVYFNPYIYAKATNNPSKVKKKPNINFFITWPVAFIGKYLPGSLCFIAGECHVSVIIWT